MLHSWEHWLSPAQHSSVLLSSLWESFPVAAGSCVPHIQYHQPSPSDSRKAFSLESASLPCPDRQCSVWAPRGWERREVCRGIPGSEGLSSEILQHWSSSAGRWQKALDGGKLQNRKCFNSPLQPKPCTRSLDFGRLIFQGDKPSLGKGSRGSAPSVPHPLPRENVSPGLPHPQNPGTGSSSISKERVLAAREYK